MKSELNKIKALLRPTIVTIPEDIAKKNISRAKAKLDEYGLEIKRFSCSLHFDLREKETKTWAGKIDFCRVNRNNCFKEPKIPIIHVSGTRVEDELRNKGIGSAMYWMAFYERLKLEKQKSTGLIVLTHSAGVNDTIANNKNSAKIWTGILGQVRKTRLQPINTGIYLPDLGDWSP